MGSTRWGSRNGYIGGYGGYSIGTITLSKSQNLYINVGGNGTTKIGGYNGGGNRPSGDTTGWYAGSGGGATHIATVSGLLSTLENSKFDILIVSGGGGGATSSSTYNANGGSGGGYMGSTIKGPTGGTQTIAGTNAKGGITGSFGKGADSTNEGAGGSGFSVVEVDYIQI